jgi:D-3-phosphoglycerate dehydrogenase
MYKIQTLNKIDPNGLDLFPRDTYEVATEINDPDGILVRSMAMHDMELGGNLKAIARAGAGVNNIPIEKCSEKGVVVFNTPGANANGVKELVLTGMLLASRRIVAGIAWAKELVGTGEDIPKLVEKNKSQFSGCEIKGKTLGVVGLGAIGVMVANDAIALGMNVVGFDPFISVESAWGLSRDVQRAVSLDACIAEADYISIHVPLNDKTKAMFNKERFELMKKSVHLLNFSRNGLVNNSDVKDALENGNVATYITDFPDEDLLKIDGVIGIPHLGASTCESEINCAVMAVEQMKDFLTTGNLKNSVNFPDCDLPVNGKSRLIIANKNIPNMVGQFTSILADASVNIADMINKHKNDYAYTIINIDNNIGDSVIDKIRSIEGVIMVRHIV